MFSEEVWNKFAQLMEEAAERAAERAIRKVLDEQREQKDKDPWMSPAEAARYLRLQPKSFYFLRRAHPEIDAMSIGEDKLRRWRRSDLDSLLKMPFMKRRP